MEVLKNDESNIFAAMGIAIILAEHNKTDEALEILKAIKEACPSHIERPSILINLAHINVVNENYESAINLYIKAIELFPRGRGDLDTELYLAKAYYKNKQYELSQKILKKLIVLYPNDMRVRFDLAICLYYHARMIFDQSYRKVSETRLAKANLQHTKNLMDFFLTKRDPLQHLPSNASAELQQAQSELFVEMRNNCDSLQ
jgi:tetratricopeptide (TPR) repeat protein